MSFLPTDYEVPVSNSGYMKFKQGDNVFRIVSKPIVGWVEWIDEKPRRYRMADKPPFASDPKKPIKHFWAFTVWNYNENSVQILEITQNTIQTSIKNFSEDADWGDPTKYDIKVTRTGESLDTEYTISPKPHKDITPEMLEAISKKTITLEALFDGKDPFDPNNRTHKPEEGEVAPEDIGI